MLLLGIAGLAEAPFPRLEVNHFGFRRRNELYLIFRTELIKGGGTQNKLDTQIGIANRKQELDISIRPVAQDAHVSRDRIRPPKVNMGFAITRSLLAPSLSFAGFTITLCNVRANLKTTNARFENARFAAVFRRNSHLSNWGVAK